MNFTESFDQFSSRLTTTDIALYAGVGLVLWILLKARLNPVQKLVLSVVEKLKSLFVKNTTNEVVPVVSVAPDTSTVDKEDVFFKLVASWKQTRDLAVRSGCVEAVKVADQMFPFLSPNVCEKDNV